MLLALQEQPELAQRQEVPRQQPGWVQRLQQLERGQVQPQRLQAVPLPPLASWAVNRLRECVRRKSMMTTVEKNKLFLESEWKL